MSNQVNTKVSKQPSKAASRKQEKANYWRTVHFCRKAIKDEKDSFQRSITVSTLKTTECADSFSAIVDSRRGIIIK